MYFATIDDYYIGDSAVYYHVAGKLDLAPILKHRLNQGESIEEAVARWDSEQHWLADWNSKTPIAGFYKNCKVVFEMKSSAFYSSMKHKKLLNNIRNINVTTISIVNP